MAPKALSVLVLFMLTGPTVIFSQSQSTDIANFISSAYSNKAFTTTPVDLKDLKLILRCGVQAPSARNSQPWHFTVIKDLETMKRIIPDALKGNILIIISGQDRPTAPQLLPSTAPWRPRTCTWPPNPWVWVRTSIRGRLRTLMQSIRTPSGFRPAISASRS